MRAWLLTVAAVLLPALGSSANYSFRNPAIRNPVGVGTAPVSSFRDSLIRTPSPIDATGNLVITGNVRGGRSFQAPVQYNSTTEFGADLGTSTLSSFLRDTTGSEDLGRYPQRYRTRPYYSPAETVATTVPGRRGVFGPASTRVRALAPQQRRPVETHLFALEPLPKQQILPGRGATTTDVDLQTLRTQYGLLADSLTTSDDVSAGEISPGLRNVERLAPGDAAMRRQDEPLTSERLREQTRQSLLEARRELRIEDRRTLMDDTRLEPEAKTPAQSAADAKDRIAAGYRLSPLETPAPSVAPALQPEAVRPAEPELGPTPGVLAPGEQDGFVTRRIEGAEAEPGAVLLPAGGAGPEEVPGAEQRDMLNRIRRQLDDLGKSVDSRLQVGDQGGGDMLAGRPQRMSPVPERYTTGSGETSRFSERQEGGLGLGKEILAPAKTSGAFGGVDYRGQTGLLSPERPTLEVSRRITSLPGELSKLSPADISSEAKRIRGAHQSLNSLAQDKFSGHMLAAQDYLKSGKYYKAANSFALASMYKPDNPQALAGRSHALFAAGEYISSALFLSRALAIDPDYAKVKIDLVTLLDGRGRLTGRIGDVEQWFARSGSGRLQLLLGYVYYQTGRLNEATKAVEAAQAKTPQSPAIPAIRAAIEGAAAR